MEERYFAASNSGRGFIGYFDRIFDPAFLDRIYIIKGGPGTGKSYFMRKIAEKAEEKGRRVIYYYCSSDQNSLDGIIIDGKLGFLDGTAPHAREASLPGCCEDIIDLGAFWDSELLAKNKHIIEGLNAEKKKYYSLAYRYLAAYEEISRGAEVLISPLVDFVKLRKSIRNIFKGIKKGDGYSLGVAICDSVGMEGRVFFHSLEEKAEQVFYISDLFDTSHFYLSAVIEMAMEYGLVVTVSYDPINSDRLDAVYLVRDKILFTASSSAVGKKISMSSFIQKQSLAPLRSSLKNSMKLRDLMLDETVLALEGVKKAHFQLEEIYKGAMDFSAKEKFTEKFIEKLSL